MSDLLQILQKYKNSRIALYGLGIETEKIIRRYGSQFLFTGLLDGYREEGSMYGMPVISFQEAAESGVKLILVVARPGSCRAIAKKMKQKCICNQIDLYDVRGRDLCADETIRYDLKNIEGITKSQLNQAMDAHSILSFDLFDTLIMRNTLFYTDIFDIMNSQLKSMGILIEEKNRCGKTSFSFWSACTGRNLLLFAGRKSCGWNQCPNAGTDGMGDRSGACCSKTGAL